ncbi:MAG: hypothetical protein R6W77_01635 [Trueperaceae bacterium]
MVDVSVRTVLRWLLTAILLVLAIHLALELFPSPRLPWDQLREIFDVDDDTSVPTYLAAALLTATAATVWLTGHEARSRSDRWTPYWFGLTALFLLAGIDEVAAMHEMLSSIVRDFLDTGDVAMLRWPWFIPVGAAMAVVFVVYLRFMLALPAFTRTHFFTGATMFVAGAIGMELLGGAFYVEYGMESRRYFAAAMTEETLEFAGTWVMLRGFLHHAAGLPADVGVRLRAP